MNKFCPETLPISKRVCDFIVEDIFDFEASDRMKQKQSSPMFIMQYFLGVYLIFLLYIM